MATKTRPKSPTRSHEHEFEIDASPQEVWKALTEAEELVNWFPLEADVEPGAEGQIVYRWMDLKIPCRIVSWEPSSHLRTTWTEGPGAGSDERATPLAVDWYLEGEKGKTRLRLVHSGFGAGREWDDEYEGTRHGWDFELRVLKHYLEYHRGQRRTALVVSRQVSLDAAQTWQQLIGPGGLLGGLEGSGHRPGDAVELRTPGADPLRGSLFHYIPPVSIGFSVPELNQSIFRIGFETCFGRPEAHVWAWLWGAPESQSADLEERLRRALERIFG